MNRVLGAVVHEIKKATPPAFFFLGFFYLLTTTKTLLLNSYTQTSLGFSVAIIAAITVAKTVLIVDAVPALNPVTDRILALVILWKSLIYFIVCSIFHWIEDIIPYLKQDHNLGVAAGHYLSEISWPEFWLIKIWLVLGLLIFTTVRELDQVFGPGSIVRALKARNMMER